MISRVNLVLFFTAVWAASWGTCHAQSFLSPVIRVKLVRFFPATISTLTVSCAADFVITDPNGQVLVQGTPGTKYDLAQTDNSEISISPESASADPESDQEGGLPQAVALTISGDDGAPIQLQTDSHSAVHSYRGKIEVSAGLSLVNDVALDDYLKGVLQPEIGGTAPLEALKAQAVASRTYAIHNLGKMSAFGADVDDTTRTQSYIGCEGESSAIDSAVDATLGDVLTYDGTLIDALFSTDCGGITADGGPSRPYLSPATDEACTANPEWHINITQPQLDQLLGQAVVNQSDPAAISVVSTDRSGRVTLLKLSQGPSIVTLTGEQLRQALGYNLVRSTLFTLTKMSDGSYDLDGRGWGHGLGLCQKGAIYFAQHSSTYIDILRHYYRSTAIQQLNPAMMVRSEPNPIGITAAPVSVLHGF